MAAGVVGLATLSSRILGFIRDMIIAKVFGAGMVTDAFFVGFRIPNMLRELLAEGALTAAFIPTFTYYLKNKGENEAWNLANKVSNLLFLILLAISGAGLIFTPGIVKVIAPGFAPIADKYALTVSLTRMMFPYILLIGMAALCMGILNSMGHFALPALSPTLFNFSIILSALFMHSFFDKPVFSLAMGVLIGGVGQLLFQLPLILKKGFRPSLDWHFNHPGVKQVFLLMLPGTLGLAANQINLIVNTLVASFLPQGSVSYLYYSNRLVQLPLGTIGIAMGVAILPTLSAHAAKGEMEALKENLRFGLRLVFFISIPSTLALIILKTPIVNVLFQRGEFTHLATLATAEALLFYSLGLTAFTGVRVIVPAFYSLQDTKTPVKIALCSVLTNIALNIILMHPLKHAGLALATSISFWLNFVLLCLALRRKIGPIGGRTIVVAVFKLTVTSVVMGIVIYSMSIFFDTNDPFPQRIFLLTTTIVVGILVYGLVAYLLKCTEFTYLVSLVQKKRTTHG